MTQMQGLDHRTEWPKHSHWRPSATVHSPAPKRMQWVSGLAPTTMRLAAMHGLHGTAHNDQGILSVSDKYS